MNFLGHFLLSHHDPELLVGNFIADAVKGKKYLEYPPKISHGIMMHRQIDHFTDSHEMVRLGRKRLFPIYRHFAGVIMDMYYDHLLAIHWTEYCKIPLENFAGQVYTTIESHWNILPEKSRYMFPYMKSGNWLLRYATTDGISKSLTGMARRLDNNSKLEQAIDQLHEQYELLKPEFERFMHDLQHEF